MKKQNILTASALAAVMLFSACNKDMNGGPDVPGGEVTEGIPTYATISVSQQAQTGTYAGAGDYAVGDAPWASEAVLNTLVVYVFDKADILEYIVNFEPADVTAKSKTFSTTTGQKRLFALANVPKEKLEDITVGMGLKAVREKALEIAQITDAAKLGTNATETQAGEGANFWMSNVYKLNQTNEDHITVEKKTDAEVDKGANNFTVYIGRMVAKVLPTFDDNVTYNAAGSLDVATATYRVRNNPTTFYTFPVYDETQLMSPHYEHEYPNAALKFFDNPDFVAVASDGVDGTASYLTENSPQLAQRHKVTFLGIKAKWIPTENATFLNADGTKVADSKTDGVDVIANDNGGTFWRVQKWQNGKIVGYCPGIYVATPTAYHTGNTADAAPDGTELKDRTTAKGDKTQTVLYVAVEYTNGIAYYAYWMRSSNTGDVASRYALKRNSFFKVNITSVEDIGDPKEDDLLDKEEDIEADTSMKATIEVLPWNDINIEGGI